jgi:hypothetical protein
MSWPGAEIWTLTTGEAVDAGRAVDGRRRPLSAVEVRVGTGRKAVAAASS